MIRPGGHFLIGLPAVNKAMTLAFRAIGFRGIDDHHVSDIHDVRAAATSAGFSVARTATLPFGVPLGWAPYSAMLLQRSMGPTAAAGRA